MKIELTKIKVDLKSQNKAKTLFRFESLVMSSGSHTLIQGQSGKGKTTLLHLISGLFLPDEGTVRLDSYQLDRMQEEERARFRRENIGIVFQKLNLIDHLTTIENILLPLSANSEGPLRAREVIQKLNLEGLENRISTLLSLGEQQRVAVARVIAARPKVILADEPTSSLDDKNAKLVMDALFAAAQGKTLVVVSHDQRLKPLFQNRIDFEELIET